MHNSTGPRLGDVERGRQHLQQRGHEVLEEKEEHLVVLLADLRQRADLRQALQREVAEGRQREEAQQDLEEVGVEDVGERYPREVHLRAAASLPPRPTPRQMGTKRKHPQIQPSPRCDAEPARTARRAFDPAALRGRWRGARTCSAASVALMSAGRELQRSVLRSTKWHSSWMLSNSLLSCALSMRVLLCVSSPRLKSKTSSLSRRRMCMLFSHRFSLVLEAPTSSGMKLGQRAGQSFFSTCAHARCLAHRRFMLVSGRLLDARRGVRRATALCGGVQQAMCVCRRGCARARAHTLAARPMQRLPCRGASYARRGRAKGAASRGDGVRRCRQPSEAHRTHLDEHEVELVQVDALLGVAGGGDADDDICEELADALLLLLGQHVPARLYSVLQDLQPGAARVAAGVAEALSVWRVLTHGARPPYACVRPGVPRPTRSRRRIRR